MRNPTSCLDFQQLGTGILVAVFFMWLVYDLPLPSGIQMWLCAIFLVAGVLYGVWDVIIGPKRLLMILAMFGSKDETKASVLSSWCVKLLDRVRTGYPVHADLIWIEQYLNKNVSTTMSRGTLSSVEHLCKAALDSKREDPGLCLSIYQMVLCRTNRSSEITPMWKRYAAVPGVLGVLETLQKPLI